MPRWLDCSLCSRLSASISDRLGGEASAKAAVVVAGGFRGGGGFSHVPTASGGYPCPWPTRLRASRSAPPRLITPGRPPIMRVMSSRTSPYNAEVPIRPGNISFRRRPEGVGHQALRGDVHLNVNHVVNNHWDRWHGHNWDGGWYHGNWHGHWDNYWHAGWSDWWANPWYARTAFWGVTGWWLGASVYNWGYLPYYNPYYTQSYEFGPTVINYQQPLQAVDYGEQADGSDAPPVSPEATQRGRGPASLLRSELPFGAERNSARIGVDAGRSRLPRAAGPDPVCDGRIPGLGGGRSLALGGRSRLGLDHDDRPVCELRHLHEAVACTGDFSPRPSERRGRAVSAGVPLPDHGAHAGRRD